MPFWNPLLIICRVANLWWDRHFAIKFSCRMACHGMQKPCLSHTALTSTLLSPFAARQGCILLHSAMWTRNSVDAPLLFVITLGSPLDPIHGLSVFKVSFHQATARLCSVWTDNFSFWWATPRHALFVVSVNKKINASIFSKSLPMKSAKFLSAFFWTPANEKCDPHAFENCIFFLAFVQTPCKWKMQTFFWQFFGHPASEKCDPLQVESENFFLVHTIIQNCLKNFQNSLWVFLKFYSKFILSFLFHSEFI